jgi:cation:H+ antiporter
MVDFFSSVVLNIIVIIVAFVVMDWASNLTINNAVKISAITRLGKTAVGFTLIAFSTSLPELTVAIIAAFSGAAALSIGNVLGSNIVNICVIVGAASLIVYYKVHRQAKQNKDNKISRNIVKSLAKSELSSIYFGYLFPRSFQ